MSAPVAASPPGELSVVLAVRREPGDNLVALGELVLDLVTTRRRVPEDLERLLQPIPTFAQPKEGWRVVVEIVLGDEPIHRVEIAGVNGRVELANQGLVCLLQRF